MRLRSRARPDCASGGASHSLPEDFRCRRRFRATGEAAAAPGGMQQLTLVSLAVLALTTPVLADDEAPKPEPKTIGIDGGLAMPTGNWGDGAGIGLGALARLEVPLQPRLVLTVRAGYIQHLGKDGPMGGSATASEIPLFGGLRYALTQKPGSEIYGAAELGIVVGRVSIDFNGQSMDASSTNLGMSLGGGYR